MRSTWTSKTFSSAVARTALILLTLLLAPAAAQAEEPFVCFPTCSRVDGRMLSVAGIAGNGLVQDIVLRVAVAGGDPNIEIDVFDADTGSTWDSPGGTDTVFYELFADPNGDGTGTTSIAGPFDGNALVGADNNWVSIVSMPNNPLALAPSGNYVYRLQVSLSVPGGSSWSNFKVRTKGVVSTATLTPIPGIFALTAPLFFNPLEIPAIYPNAAFFETEPTNFDGTVNLFVDIPNDSTFFEFFEGDSDRGKGDGTDLDTDDPNSDNLAVPSFAVGTNARPEGVAFVDPGCTTEISATACPADDRSDPFFVRSPSIQIRLITPSGEEFLEGNPSGELEWERIRLSNAAVLDPSVDDFITGGIPAGLYQVRLEGIDLSNLNAFSFSEEVVGLCQGLDTPCRRSLRSYRLGDTVFLDLNGDGIQQLPAEPGLGGVIVDLRGSMGTLLESRVTDVNGNYSFEVAEGNYTVEVAAENFSPPGASGAVGDRVWLDIDGDALDSGEPGLSNVRVELVDTINGTAGDADDVVMGSTLTDTDGNYIFTDLPAGTYFTRVIESTVASGLALSAGGSNPSPTRTILAGGACSEPDCLDLDFPYTNGDPATAVAGDYVWFDANGDGLQGADEVGFTGVTMQLTNTTTGRVADLTTTNGGFYLFTGLVPGDTYVITVTDHADVLTTFSATSPVSSPSSVPFTPAAGDVLLDKDFGYTTGTSVTIADRVWSDDNLNGLVDGAEVGIAGVTVNLLDFAGSVVATTTTVADGSFAFANLPTGLYSVVVTDLDDLTNGRLPTTTESLQGLEVILGAGGVSAESFGYAPVVTGALEGLSGTTIKDPVSNVDVQTDDVPIGDPAGNNPDFDFGYIALGSLGDRVWLDANGDGVQGSPVDEPGLVGVTVELFNPDTGVTLSMMTGPDGVYLFTDLLPNAGYVVTVVASTLPPGLVPTFDLDDPAQPINTPNTTVAPLGTSSPGFTEDREDVDFGYKPNVSSLGDRVWHDLDGDGVQDNPFNEVGINDVTVELLDSGGSVITSDVTSGDGDYFFGGLMAGTYTVRVDATTLPEGFLQTFDIEGPLDDQATVTLGPGEDRDDVDFGYADECLTDIDFETDFLGDSLKTGDLIENQWSRYGIKVSTDNPIVHPAMIFDTRDPTGGDHDLGTPNEDFGGPGIGSGGGLGSLGANTRDLGYVLIISEDGDQLDPDDNASGGTLIFTFTHPVRIDQVGILDIDEGMAGTVTAFDAGGAMIGSVSMAGSLGNNSVQTVNLGASGVRRLEVYFPGSGAVTDLVFCADCRVMQVRDNFETVAFDNNDGADDWAAGWIENDTQAGGAGPSAGQVQIHDGLLTLDDQPNTGGHPSIAREVDLSGASSATLNFEFLTSSGVDRSDAVTVEISDDGGATWTKLKKITNIRGAVTRTKSFDISNFISEQTQVRFRVSRYYGGWDEFFCLSFVEIETDCTDCQAVDVIDDFEVVAFDNNDGPDSWSDGWIENDPEYGGKGPWDGQVQIHDGLITLDDYPNTGGQPSIAREVDLSGAGSAHLSFDFYTSGGVDYDDAVTVEVSDDGGATWTTLEVITGISGAVSGIRNIDISSFASAETQVRFRVSNKYGGSNELFCLGFVRITASC